MLVRASERGCIEDCEKVACAEYLLFSDAGYVSLKENELEDVFVVNRWRFHWFDRHVGGAELP